MRECKFRAWCAKHKRWLCGYEMPHLGGFSLFGEVMVLGEWSHILDRFIFQRDGHTGDDDRHAGQRAENDAHDL
jgi:hypothetical protein